MPLNRAYMDSPTGARDGAAGARIMARVRLDVGRRGI